MKFLFLRNNTISQPHPVFFTEEEIERMSKTEGSYQYKGDSDGEESDSN